MTEGRRWDRIGDYIICLAVFSQAALILLQHLLASVVGLEIEETTIYRVVLTIILLVPSILVALYRKPQKFISVFVLVGLVLLLTYIFFPENRDILIEQAFRFLLPVVVPSFVCLLAVENFDVIKASLRIVGWISAIGALVFLMFFLMGRFSIERYSMSFSYACLFPMLALFSQKRTLPILISLLIFLEVLAFGSRGAAVCFIVYIIFALFQEKGKTRVFVIVGCFLLLLAFPYFVEYLEHLGLYSRTVNLMMSGGFTESEGREFIYGKALAELNNNLITGLGLYGDRASFGTYCHNIVLEILVNFGIIIGTLILFVSIFIILKVLFISKGDVYNVAVVLVFYGILPHMFSGSYLQEPNFALLMGYCAWVISSNKANHYLATNNRKQ